mmetsp:Transcript_25953/g.76069  ORF Transcript_25953/g.76069 Transcript_25953/m.76069 type:complete len:256 (-) Transcript_25953:133-900(-)
MRPGLRSPQLPSVGPGTHGHALPAAAVLDSASAEERLSDEGTHLNLNADAEARRSHPNLPSLHHGRERAAQPPTRRASDIPSGVLAARGLAGRAPPAASAPKSNLPGPSAQGYAARRTPQPPQRTPGAGAPPSGGRVIVRGPTQQGNGPAYSKNPSRLNLNDGSRRAAGTSGSSAQLNPTAASAQHQRRIAQAYGTGAGAGAAKRSALPQPRRGGVRGGYADSLRRSGSGGSSSSAGGGGTSTVSNTIMPAVIAR